MSLIFRKELWMFGLSVLFGSVKMVSQCTRKRDKAILRALLWIKKQAKVETNKNLLSTSRPCMTLVCLIASDGSCLSSQYRGGKIELYFNSSLRSGLDSGGELAVHPECLFLAIQTPTNYFMFSPIIAADQAVEASPNVHDTVFLRLNQGQMAQLWQVTAQGLQNQKWRQTVLHVQILEVNMLAKSTFHSSDLAPKEHFGDRRHHTTQSLPQSVPPRHRSTLMDNEETLAGEEFGALQTTQAVVENALQSQPGARNLISAISPGRNNLLAQQLSKASGASEDGFQLDEHGLGSVPEAGRQQSQVHGLELVCGSASTLASAHESGEIVPSSPSLVGLMDSCGSEGLTAQLASAFDLVHSSYEGGLAALRERARQLDVLFDGASSKKPDLTPTKMRDGQDISAAQIAASLRSSLSNLSASVRNSQSFAAIALTPQSRMVRCRVSGVRMSQVGLETQDRAAGAPCTVDMSQPVNRMNSGTPGFRGNGGGVRGTEEGRRSMQDVSSMGFNLRLERQAGLFQSQYPGPSCPPEEMDSSASFDSIARASHLCVHMPRSQSSSLAPLTLPSRTECLDDNYSDDGECCNLASAHGANGSICSSIFSLTPRTHDATPRGADDSSPFGLRSTTTPTNSMTPDSRTLGTGENTPSKTITPESNVLARLNVPSRQPVRGVTPDSFTPGSGSETQMEDNVASCGADGEMDESVSPQSNDPPAMFFKDLDQLRTGSRSGASKKWQHVSPSVSSSRSASPDNIAGAANEDSEAASHAVRKSSTGANVVSPVVDDDSLQGPGFVRLMTQKLQSSPSDPVRPGYTISPSNSAQSRCGSDLSRGEQPSTASNKTGPGSANPIVEIQRQRQIHPLATVASTTSSDRSANSHVSQGASFISSIPRLNAGSATSNMSTIQGHAAPSAKQDLFRSEITQNSSLGSMLTSGRSGQHSASGNRSETSTTNIAISAVDNPGKTEADYSRAAVNPEKPVLSMYNATRDGNRSKRKKLSTDDSVLLMSPKCTDQDRSLAPNLPLESSVSPFLEPSPQMAAAASNLLGSSLTEYTAASGPPGSGDRDSKSASTAHHTVPQVPTASEPVLSQGLVSGQPTTPIFKPVLQQPHDQFGLQNDEVPSSFTSPEVTPQGSAIESTLNTPCTDHIAIYIGDPLIKGESPFLPDDPAPLPSALNSLSTGAASLTLRESSLYVNAEESERRASTGGEALVSRIGKQVSSKLTRSKDGDVGVSVSSRGSLNEKGLGKALRVPTHSQPMGSGSREGRNSYGGVPSGADGGVRSSAVRESRRSSGSGIPSTAAGDLSHRLPPSQQQQQNSSGPTARSSISNLKKLDVQEQIKKLEHKSGKQGPEVKSDDTQSSVRKPSDQTWRGKPTFLPAGQSNVPAANPNRSSMSKPALPSRIPQVVSDEAAVRDAK